MQNIYKRKQNAPARGEWTAADLEHATTAVLSQEMSTNQAATHFGIPKSTLKRRLQKNQFTKENRLGPDSILGAAAEEKLATHIKKLQANGFAPTRSEVRAMAFNLAKRLGIKTKFDEKEGKAGIKWLQSFLRRRPEIAVRKVENTSIARVRGMSRKIIHNYFNDLGKLLTDHSLYDKPRHIFNADETGLQLNTRPGEVLAAKGSKCVAAVSPGEKACCYAQGMFLPPYCIFKGKNRKEEWKDGMPPGSRIEMGEKSAYVKSNIFFDWLQNNFCPRKPAGTCLLIVDDHTSHTTDVEMLEFAENNSIILFCLPPHTTHYLQPLDRGFFKSLKGYYYESCRNFIRGAPNRRLNRLQFGKLLGEAWGRAATTQNAISAFRSTGIVPLNERAIPDYAFLTEDSIHQAISGDIVPEREEDPHIIQFQPRNEASTQRPRSPTSLQTVFHQSRNEEPKPGPSGTQCNARTPKNTASIQDITPGKALDEISPVPIVNQAANRARRRIVGVITTPEYINKRKDIVSKNKGTKTDKKSDSAKGRRRKVRKQSSGSSDSAEILLNDSSGEEESISDLENECVGCKEDYRVTKSKDNWLQCVVCNRWLHETCTSFLNVCQACGTEITKKKKTNH